MAIMWCQLSSDDHFYYASQIIVIHFQMCSMLYYFTFNIVSNEHKIEVSLEQSGKWNKKIANSSFLSNKKSHSIISAKKSSQMDFKLISSSFLSI